MSSDILLISPASIVEGASGSRIDMRSLSPPLGLLYVAAVLQEEGHVVEIIDMNGEPDLTRRELAHRIRASQAELIGLSTLSQTFRTVAGVARLCKEELPETPIVLGGYSATFNHDRILRQYDQFDFVVRQEGEETARELAAELETSAPEFSHIRGLTYRENGHIRVNENRPPIEDLDALPFPAYELVAHVNYGAFGGLRISRGRLGSLLTSRGCPYRCTFCSCSAFTSATIRWRSPANVVDELEYLVDRFGIREYAVVDDIFTLNKEHVLAICRLIREHGLDLEWYCEGRVNQADEAMFREMAAAGCRAIFLGIESCVNRILKYYKKGLTYEMAQAAAKKAQRAGLDVVGSFILGAPVETVEEMWATVRGAAALDIDFADFNVLRLTRGMPLWEELVREGVLDDEAWEDAISGFDIHPEVSGMDHAKLLRQFHRAYYLRGRFLLRQLRRTLFRRNKQVLLNLRHLRQFVGDLRDLIHLTEGERPMDTRMAWHT